MATRIYFTTLSPPISPADWEFANLGAAPVDAAGEVVRAGTSAMQTLTQATGTTSPILIGMYRATVGPLSAQTIGAATTFKGQMRCAENNNGANATLAIAVKIIASDGTDRAILKAPVASDSATSPFEMATSLTNRKFYNLNENATITVDAGATVVAGDYLVIEIGFRAATTIDRTISLSVGDNSATDLPEDTTTTAANNPWVEFSQTLSFQTRIVPLSLALATTTFAPVVSTPRLVTPSVCSLTLTSFAPTIRSGVLVTPASASLTLSASTPVVAAPRQVVPAAAALSTTTFAPGIFVGVRVTPATAALLSNAFAPRLATGIIPTTAALALGSAAPTVLTPRRLIPSVLSLALTPFAPIVAAPSRATPAAASLSLTTFAPVVTVAGVGQISPPAASLVVQGFAPEVVLSTVSAGGAGDAGGRGFQVVASRTKTPVQRLAEPSPVLPVARQKNKAVAIGVALLLLGRS